MNQRRINELFETLRDLCQQEFGFEPGRVSANLHFMGQISHGKYLFRDSMCHAQIHLTTKPSRVELYERPNGAKPDWTAELIASYRLTDEQVSQDLNLVEANGRNALGSGLWRTHGAYIKSLFRQHPTYVEGQMPPCDAIRALVDRLIDQDDPEVIEFASLLEINDPRWIAHWLTQPYHLSNKEEMWAVVHQHPDFNELVRLAKSVKGKQDTRGQDKAEAFAGKIVQSLPGYLRVYSPRVHSMVLVDEAMKCEYAEPTKDIHYRVSMSNDFKPHKILSIWAPTKDAAKQIASAMHPDWKVVQARISSKQTREETA